MTKLWSQPQLVARLSYITYVILPHQLQEKESQILKKIKLKKNNEQTNKQIHNTTLFLRLSYIFSSSVWHDPLKRISNK